MKKVYASYSELKDHYSVYYYDKPCEVVFYSRPALWQEFEIRRFIQPPIIPYQGWSVEDIAETE